eukprot:12215812-Alexandrium_andersonii.AAC.1
MILGSWCWRRRASAVPPAAASGRWGADFLGVQSWEKAVAPSARSLPLLDFGPSPRWRGEGRLALPAHRLHAPETPGT